MRKLMLRYTGMIALLIFAGFGFTSMAHAEQVGHANFWLGFKALDEDDWDPLDLHSALGVEVSFGSDSWPVLIAIDYLGSSDDGSRAGLDFDARTAEFDVGVRKIWDAGENGHPYVGGGVALISGDLEAGPLDDDDNGIGVWVGGGAFWTLGTRFNIGINARYSTAEVDLLGEEFAAGGFSGGILLGFGWGGN